MTDAPLKVLHVVPTFYPAHYWGGPIVTLYELCNHVAALPGHAIRVLTTDASGPRPADRLRPEDISPEAYPGYEVLFCRKMGKTFSAAMLTRLAPLVRWADVVHLTGVYSSTTLPTLLAARGEGKPVVWSPRGALQRWKGSRRAMAKNLWDRACAMAIAAPRTVLHVTSEEEQTESRRRFPELRAAIIPNGVGIGAADSVRAPPAGRPMRLAYLGRLDPKKGIENLIDAMALLPPAHSMLSIYGGGDPDYAKALAERVTRQALDARVRFCGVVTGDEKERALASADLVVVPSHTENFGMVVAEALAHGTPVIASTGTPWRELDARRAGRWVPNDPASLASAIRSLEGEDLGAMGQRGREWMISEYGWDSVARRMADLYASLAHAA
jgi:glycosyltransferase involved in cell wall biosynthesis